MRKYLLALVLVLIAVTSVQLWATMGRTTQKKEMEQAGTQALPQIGGAFTLTGQDGKTVHDTDFHGRVMLVFFGFTHCPDTCPATMQVLSRAMELLGAKADRVVPVFISVDPVRDTPAALKDFLSHFDKRAVGLTGTPEQIRQVTEAYKGYAAKAADEHSESHSHDADYNVDHSAYIYMMGKDGKYLKIYPYNVTEQELAHAVEYYLSQGTANGAP